MNAVVLIKWLPRFGRNPWFSALRFARFPGPLPNEIPPEIKKAVFKIGQIPPGTNPTKNWAL